MELQHFSHNHPLIFSEERSHETDHVHEYTYCAACGEVVVSGQRFSCDACGFHLHKHCAEAASQLNHPFHRDHSFKLLASSPYGEGNPICDLCNQDCDNFVYHCSCNSDLHIKCAMLSCSIAEKNIAHLDPTLLISNEDQLNELAKCFACWKPLLDSEYLSLDSGFSMHKNCVESPLEISSLCHPQHSVFLQFNTQRLPCRICQETQHRGIVYCCLTCKFAFHIQCVSLSPVIEDTSCHEHPFSRFFRRVSFMCDACGTSGDCVSYICSTCSIIVHKKCISLPRIIKTIWHRHPVFHKYFVPDNDFCGIQECGICHEEVTKEYGSYSCSDCKFLVHVKCVLELPGSYNEIKSIDDYEELSGAEDPAFYVIKEIKIGENVINTEIKHFGHEHNLVLCDEVKDDSRCCDGCTRLILAPYYDCLQCDFCLRKSCAELPKKMQVWFHFHQLPLTLIPNSIFTCEGCGHQCSSFAYKCEETMCGDCFCVHCAGHPLSTYMSQGHNHLLSTYPKHDGQCNACGDNFVNLTIFRCKDCDFNMHFTCAVLPLSIRHKCDEHLLKLTCYEDNDYPEYHYCDICEKTRDPMIWFYHCTLCDTSVHRNCALGDYPCIKRGFRIVEDDHPHCLIVVQKDYDYPEHCCKCGQLCLDVALECTEAECNYIIHRSCPSAEEAQ